MQTKEWRVFVNIPQSTPISENLQNRLVAGYYMLMAASARLNNSVAGKMAISMRGRNEEHDKICAGVAAQFMDLIRSSDEVKQITDEDVKKQVTLQLAGTVIKFAGIAALRAHLTLGVNKELFGLPRDTDEVGFGI